MSEAQSAPAGASLLGAYQAALAALEQGGPLAAVTAFTELRAVCATLGEAGVLLSTAELAEAQALQARCQSSLSRAGSGLNANLIQNASSRRANHAYRSEP